MEVVYFVVDEINCKMFDLDGVPSLTPMIARFRLLNWVPEYEPILKGFLSENGIEDLRVFNLGKDTYARFTLNGLAYVKGVQAVYSILKVLQSASNQSGVYFKLSFRKACLGFSNLPRGYNRSMVLCSYISDIYKYLSNIKNKDLNLYMDCKFDLSNRYPTFYSPSSDLVYIKKC